jgi:outer membrane lipoprotein-sorting protein
LNDEVNFKAYFSESKSEFIVRLKPLAAKLKESLKEIIIHFDRMDYTVNGVEMMEAGGDCTRITFTNKKLNQPISDEKFMLH